MSAAPRAVEPERRELPMGRRVFLPMAGDEARVEFDELPLVESEAWSDGQWLTQVAWVRFAEEPRPVLVDARDVSLRKGDAVLVEQDRAVDLATVSVAPRRQWGPTGGLRRVMRRAAESDLRAESRLRLREAEGKHKASEVVRRLDLPAKVVRVEYSGGGNRCTVFLASDERIELRDLGRGLTEALGGRVEIRHLGVRDAARNIGGVGPCGLQLCCNTYLRDFAPVSIRQAKDQGLALNPQRVSGVCGRLMCCLVYEDAFYRQQRALFPKQNKRVITPRGEGRVRDCDVLARTVRVLFPDGGVETYDVDAVRPASAPAGAPDEGAGAD